MQKDRQELLRVASRRVRRGKRTTGRIVASALGFGMAYYFDTENGELRRRQLRKTVQHALSSVKDACVPSAEDPPVFHPVLRTHRVGGTVGRAGGPAAVAR